MKLTSAFILGCLFCCASTILADGPGTRATNTYGTLPRVAQVVASSPTDAGSNGTQAEVEDMVPFVQAVPVYGDADCTSAHAAFGPNRCPRPTMNQYTSPSFSYQIWANYPAQKACEEMKRDQLLFSPCPSGFCCRRPLAGACAKAHCVNGLNAAGCAHGVGAYGGGVYGTAGCAAGACGPTGCGLGHRLFQGKAGDCGACDTPCDLAKEAQSQSPVLPMAAFGNAVEVK